VSYDYSGLKGTSKSLVERFGRTVTLRARSFSGAANNPDVLDVDTETTAVITDYNARDVDGTLIKVTDKMAIMHSDVTPDIDYQVVDGGIVYSVINCNDIKPGDTSLIYKLQLRA
jgi:hypothetical protein